MTKVGGAIVLIAVVAAVLVLGFNFLGDGLRDALDPASTR